MEWSTSGGFKSAVSYPVNVVCPNSNLSVASISGSIVNKRYGNKFKGAKSRQYLAQEVVQKMINKLLVEKRIAIKKIARVLAISTCDVERLGCSKEIYLQLIGKINLPLIMLYCRTKWK